MLREVSLTIGDGCGPSVHRLDDGRVVLVTQTVLPIGAAAAFGASVGKFQPSGSYTVGHRGPEIFVPRSRA